MNPRGLAVDASTSRGCLRFSTDARSAKIGEFALASARSLAAGGDGRAFTELAWFFPITREQYRLRCEVRLIFSPTSAVVATAAHAEGLARLQRTDADAAAEHLAFWRSHVPSSRGLFELAPPGTHKRRAVQGDLDRFEPQPVDEDRPSSNFVTVLLLPVRCDYLKLPRPEEDARGGGRIQKVEHHQRESNLQPTRTQMRWLHTLDETTNQWAAVELNP